MAAARLGAARRGAARADYPPKYEAGAMRVA